MLSKRPFTLIAIIAATALTPAFAQMDMKATALKHLKTSRDFTLKIADQMPAESYDFKLTPPQMSFAEQMVHLAQAQIFMLQPLTGGNANPGRPASMSKSDVIAFVRKSFDSSIDQLSRLTPEQFTKSYQGEEGTMSGAEIVMMVLDHTTHHRASAEMYLRAKGIAPAEYVF